MPKLRRRRGRIPNKELTWNLLGLQVGRKTEIIALVAFVLSVSGVLWQVYIYTRGAVVRLFPTEQIAITATDVLSRSYTDRESLLALIATMAYVNDGETGQNAIVRREYISMLLGQRNIEHRWYEFGSSDIENGTLKFKRDSEARPFPAVAASATSHETLFAPWEIDCTLVTQPCDTAKNFVKWDDFLAAVKINPNINFTISAEIYPSKMLAATCAVRLRDWEIAALEKDKWLTATCIDSDAAEEPQRKAQSSKISATKK
jgi:hypothetical protein